MINAKAKRIENIIRCSKIYKDEIHQKLQLQYDNDKDLSLKVHSSCVNEYVHPKEVERALKRQKEDEGEADAAPRKRARRSEQLKFNFFEHCIFCGEDCQVKKDPKHISADKLTGQKRKCPLRQKSLQNVMNGMMTGQHKFGLG